MRLSASGSSVRDLQLTRRFRFPQRIANPAYPAVGLLRHPVFAAWPKWPNASR